MLGRMSIYQHLLYSVASHIHTYTAQHRQGCQSPVPGSCMVHVVASRRTVPGHAVCGARHTLIAGARLRLTITGARLTVPGAMLAVPSGARCTVMGARLAIPDARLAVPGGARLTSMSLPACRCTVPAWSWMTIQPAPCLVPAKAEAHLHHVHAYRQDV